MIEIDFYAGRCSARQLPRRHSGQERPLVLLPGPDMIRFRHRSGVSPTSDDVRPSDQGIDRRPRKLIRSLLICLLIGSSLGAVWDSVAVKKVREGIQSFAAGEYEAARAAFDAARSAEPDNETITFDQACTLTAQGELDQAKDLFQQAALAPDRQLSSDAHYNVGNLAAVNAKETLGSDPVNVDPDKRQEVISGLLSAVGHYRDCLRIEETHPEARHNLELIRLFIKHIQAEWEQRDREQAREELGLLEFLAMIEQRQQGLRSVPALLAREKNSPHLRQALRETVDAQRQLQEEIEPLKQKLTAELQPAAAGQLPPSAQPPPQATDEQFHQIQALLDQMADDAGELMLEAADQVHAGELEAAHQTQRETLDQLNEIYMVVAPFAKVLERAIPVQEGLAQKSESMDESSGPPSDAGPDPDSSVDSGKPPHAGQNGSAGVEPDEAAEFSWQQSHITDWGRLLSLKAEVELPQAEAQVEEMATQAAQTPAASSDDDSAGSEQSAADADDRSSESSATHDPAAQLQALVESLRKAIELAPQVEEHSASAEQHLASSTFDQALSDQQEALRLLKEIAEPLSEQNEQNEQDKQNQQDQDENGQQDQQQDAQDQNETQQDPQNEPSDSDQQEQQEQQQKSSQERAESVLRRAREREREHRDLEKELRKILGGISPVDKDW